MSIKIAEEKDDETANTNLELYGNLNNGKLVLQDGEHFPDVANLQNGDVFSAPTAINVENCSDVIVGPVTQFHGSVVIYQGIPDVNGTVRAEDNADLVKSESTASDSSPLSINETSLVRYVKNNNKKLAFGGLVLMVIITVTIILVSKSSSKLEDDVIGGGSSSIPLGPGFLVSRQDWQASPPKNLTLLKLPIPYVVLIHSVTPTCQTLDECSRRMRSIQDYHLGHNFFDIAYNFMIGGDGNAYVGRGWDRKNSEMANSIGLCFIGNYDVDKLTTKMVDIAKALLKKGVDEGKIASNYTLLCHNQITTTDSPGKNVIAVAKTWPHFNGNFVENN